MSARPIYVVTLVAVLAFSSACGSSPVRREVPSGSQVAKLIAEENIEHVSSVEQQPQDDGTVALLVTSRLRSTSFGGCLADRADIELVKSGKNWIISSMSEGNRLSFSACDEKNIQFHFVSGAYSDEMVGIAVRGLRNLISGSFEPGMVSGSTELRDSIQRVRLGDVHLILIRECSVELQVVSRFPTPRMLGTNFFIEDKKLKRVYLSEDSNMKIAGSGK